jgi:glycosyltransferase involved in cell wall biosynthesis
MSSISPLPKVSIITPSFNQGKFLEASICSVLEQNYPNIEYIIVDGGSQDESVEVIKKYQDRLAWWVSEKDKGHADALNKGFSRATGEILAWLNSDDIYFPNAISEVVAVLTSHPEVGMVYGDAELIDDAGMTVGQFGSKQTSYRKMLRGSVRRPSSAPTFGVRWDRSIFPCFTVLIMTYGFVLQKYLGCCMFPNRGRSSVSMAQARPLSTMTVVTRTCCECWNAKGEAGFPCYVYG